MPAPAHFRAVVVDHERQEPAAVRDLAMADLKGELLLEVPWSSLNFKDALASRPDGQVARSSPLVLGVDHVGVVRESGDARYAEGDVVIAHGHDLGVSHHGGLADWSRVSADWVVPLPGSAHPARDDDPRHGRLHGGCEHPRARAPRADARRRPGARHGRHRRRRLGGVAMLAAHGYEVHASTGKPDTADWLRELGAREVIDRESVTNHAGRPLSKQLWAATVDSVGGATLAGALSATRYGGAVAASGLTGSPGLETTVMPFILRHVSLLGIDSSATPRRRARRSGSASRPTCGRRTWSCSFGGRSG